MKKKFPINRVFVPFKIFYESIFFLFLYAEKSKARKLSFTIKSLIKKIKEPVNDTTVCKRVDLSF